MPDGRLSSTVLRICLYSATAPVEASRGRRISAMARDRRLEEAERGGGHRELLETAIEERGHAARVRRHIPAEAHRYPRPPAVRYRALDELEHRGIEGISECHELAIAAIAGGQVLHEVVAADGIEVRIETVDRQCGRRHLH